MTESQTHQWALHKIIDKAIFDICKSDNTNINRLDAYFKTNAFIATVHLRSNGSTYHVRVAQERLHQEFGRYHATKLRSECFDKGKVLRRNKKFQPLAFIAFDIEGSRQNGFSTKTNHPHGHGIILFHERTIANFKEANRRFLTLEGGYNIPNPTPGISVINLKPVNSLADLSRYLGYSLKLEGKLQNGDTNFAPYNFYPTSSVDFPFWRTPPVASVRTYTTAFSA